MEEEKKTNKLEYYVPKSERTLRELHLMFASADSPDRMSNIAQRINYGLTTPLYPRVSRKNTIDRCDVARNKTASPFRSGSGISPAHSLFA